MMHIKLKTLRAALVAAMVIGYNTAIAQSTIQPNNTTKIVVATTAGGPADLVARTLGVKLGEIMGSPVIVENKAGANGNIAADFVAKSKPDGQTLLLATGAFVINPAVYKKLNFNTEKDFVPVAVALPPGSFVLVTHPSVPAKNVA
jgi:tripartite-type tricarboxylate transporter receptor subunit TctC